MVGPSVSEFLTTSSWSFGPMPLLSRILALPKVPAERTTRPEILVTSTIPSYPPVLKASTSTPVMWPPSRMTRFTVVFSQRLKLPRVLALVRYVARGPPRSPPENMKGALEKVRFLLSGALLAVTWLQPAARRPADSTSKPCW